MPSDVFKVEVTVYMGFDDVGDEAFRTVWSVAEEMLDKYGIWIDIIPINVWIYDPMGLSNPDLPRIDINGRTFITGRAPSREELIDIILSIASNKGGKPGREVAIAAVIKPPGSFLDAVMSAA